MLIGACRGMDKSDFALAELKNDKKRKYAKCYVQNLNILKINILTSVIFQGGH
jgi:hypothetical protein